MNRAIVQNGYNPEDPEATLVLLEKPIPEVTPGNVIVQIKLRLIHPTDRVGIRSGRFVHSAKGPIVPGSEGYGVIHAVGDSVTSLKVGDRVVPFVWEGLLSRGEGSWQQYVRLKEDTLAKVPDSISDEVAAQLTVNPLMVYAMLKDLDVPKGEYILQNAAASVLGRLVIQLAKHWGIKTINIVRRPEQKEELKQLGADEVICSTTEDVVARVREIMGKKLAYRLLDCVGGLASKVFVYGALGGDEIVVRIRDLFRRVRVNGWMITDLLEVEGNRKGLVEEGWKLLESKVLVPYTGEKFDLANFKDAIKRSEETGRGGKVLLSS